MTKPCIICGTPSDGPRCDDHRIRRDPKPADHVHANLGRWKALSAKARRLQGWCTWCGATTDLTTDHIIPFSICPALAHCIDNCQVLCRTCNGKRGNRFTTTEAHAVLERLQATYDRRPTKSGRQRLDAAREALSKARGDTPTAAAIQPAASPVSNYTPEVG